MAMIIELHRLAFHNSIGKFEERHIWAAPFAIDCEETKTRRRKIKKSCVAVGHQLIGFLRRGVERHWMLGALVLRPWQHGIGTIDGTGRGIQQVLREVAATAL